MKLCILLVIRCEGIRKNLKGHPGQFQKFEEKFRMEWNLVTVYSADKKRDVLIILQLISY
jgi:hypothetical protein